MTIAIGYIRVSSGKQARGMSLQDQEERIRAWCVARGFELVRIYVEKKSGKNIKGRPQFQAALDHACREAAALIVWSMDRFARNTRQALETGERLETAGADLVVLKHNIDTTTAAGRLFFTMVAAFAEFEREQLSERMQNAAAYRKEHGLKYSPNVPYGKRLASGGRLEADPQEQQVLAQMKSWRLRGGYSLARVAERLEREGVLTKTGKKRWSRALIASIIRRSDDE